MEDHVHRPSPVDSWVLINAGWYKLVPTDELCIYTSAHAQGNLNAVRAEHGEEVAEHVLQVGPVSRTELGKARIAVCTHELARREHSDSVDYGVQRYLGQRRKNVIWDEQPGFVSIPSVSRADIVYLSEQLRVIAEGAAVRHIIRAIEDRCRERLDSDGARLEPTHILTRQEYLALADIDYSPVAHGVDAEKIADVLLFLDAASHGNCFMDRGARGPAGERSGQRRCFVAYKRDFQAHPGIVVLDATSNLSPVPKLLPNAKVVDTPQADYRNLQIAHLDMPGELRHVARRCASRELDKEFIRFVRKSVLEYTEVGDEILVVVHKRQVENEHSLHDHSTWQGRKVAVLHWGGGIGSNKWLHASHVFLFSEFHVPRSAHVAEGYGLQGLPASTESFNRDAIGQVLKGAPAQAQKGQLLRWFKQLACRGRIRNIGNDGACKEMKLFTTMHSGTLIENYAVLFPGAPEPKFVGTPINGKPTKGVRLANYLMSSSEVHLCASKVANDLDIKVSEVGRAFSSHACAPLTVFGWHFTPGNGRQSKPFFTKGPPLVNSKFNNKEISV